MEDSWPNLFQKLVDGEIDLLSDVSYTEERTQYMLYPALAIGAESYYIYIDADNTTISPENLQSLDGQRVGVNKGSFQEGLLRNWAEKNKVSLDIIELTDDEAFSMEMLAKGEIDAFVSMDSFGAHDRVIPVCKIGASDYYFAVNKDRLDLLTELNNAMSAIQDEDPYYNQRMFDEYINVTKTNAFLTPGLENWLSAHGPIRVGYWDDYLPFCGTDKLTGEFTGALKDYLAFASNCLKNARIQFEAVPYPSVSAAMTAMKNGKIDCVFPVNLSTYDSEVKGVLTVNPIMKTYMSVLIEAEEQSNIAPGKRLTVAIDEGNINYETLMMDELPNWTAKSYPTMEDCFRAVAAKEANALLACNHRMYVYEPLRTKYKLAALPTGETMGLSFAVSADAPELYSILNKIANLSKNEDMEYALVSYMNSSHKATFMEFMEDNWLTVLALVTAVFAVLLFLVYKRLAAEKKVVEQQKQMEEALRRELAQKEQLESITQMAYRDSLTGVKSKHAYVEAEENMDRRIADRDVSAFAVVLFDLNGLKEVNDSQGHEIGDRFIKEACKLICTRFKHSPVFRIGGDEFVAILEGDDYDNREELLSGFDRQMDDNLERGGITVASGCSCFVPSQDSSIHAVLERADAIMYHRKKQMKEMNV